MKREWMTDVFFSSWTLLKVLIWMASNCLGSELGILFLMKTHMNWLEKHFMELFIKQINHKKLYNDCDNISSQKFLKIQIFNYNRCISSRKQL